MATKGQASKLLGRKEGGKEVLPTRVAGLAIFSQKPFLASCSSQRQILASRKLLVKKRVKGPLVLLHTPKSVVPVSSYKLLGGTDQGPNSLGSSEPE